MAKGSSISRSGYCRCSPSFMWEPSPKGPESALATVARELAGPTLLGAVGVGLLALAVWELLVAVPDIEGRGRHGVALFQRGASLIGTLLYGSLGIWAISAAGGGAAAGLALFWVWWRLLCAMFARLEVR